MHLFLISWPKQETCKFVTHVQNLHIAALHYIISHQHLHQFDNTRCMHKLNKYHQCAHYQLLSVRYMVHTLLIIILLHLQCHVYYAWRFYILGHDTYKAVCMGGLSSHKNSCVHRQRIYSSIWSALKLPVEQVVKDTVEGIMSHPRGLRHSLPKLESSGCVVTQALLTMHTKFVCWIWGSNIAWVGAPSQTPCFLT